MLNLKVGEKSEVEWMQGKVKVSSRNTKGQTGEEVRAADKDRKEAFTASQCNALKHVPQVYILLFLLACFYQTVNDLDDCKYIIVI